MRMIRRCRCSRSSRPSPVTSGRMFATTVRSVERIRQRRCSTSTMNVLKHHGILAGPMGRTGKDVGVFIGNSALPILATQGGLVEHLVKLNDKVDAGQKVAIQRNSFGEVVAKYTSRVAGEETGQRSDAMA